VLAVVAKVSMSIKDGPTKLGKPRPEDRSKTDPLMIQMVDSMARVETHVININEKIDTHIKDINPRMAKVERRQIYFMGGASSIGAISAWLIATFFKP